MQSSLQEKQAYLRENIEQDHYEDFYQFCEKDVGSVDIYSWSLHDVIKIVGKFKAHLAQEQREQDEEIKNKHEQSYYDYQSADGPDQPYDYGNGHGHALEPINQDRFSDCQTSRVAKSSAVDLLDEVFEKQTTKSHFDQSEGKAHNNSSSVSFDQFDFWTSTMSNSQVNKQRESEPAYDTGNNTRMKSMTHFQVKKTKETAHTPRYDPKYSQNRNRNSTQSHGFSDMGMGGDLFQPVGASKKTSPYLKKQQPQQPIEIKKSGNRNHEIKLKEVKEIEQKPKTTVNVVTKEKGEKWLVEEKVFSEELMCYKSALRTQIGDRSLNVFIDKHDIVQRSFLASDYAMYNMKITPSGIECKRNYDDFSKLKANLQKFFPGQHIPYLEDNSWFGNTNTDYLSHQKKMLQFFVRDLLRNREYRNSRLLQQFLLVKEHKPMKRKFQKYEKMEKLKGIEELCLMDGRVKVLLSNEQKNYNENMKRFVNRMDDYFSRLRKLLENVSKYYFDLMNTYKSLSSLSEEIEKEVKSFNTKVTTNQIKNLGSVFRMMRETFKEDQSNMKFEHELYTKKIQPFIKYEHCNFLELNKLIDINHRFEKTYEKRNQTEAVNIRESYNSEEAIGAKRGILEESRNLIVLKYQTGFIGRQVRMESQRVFDEMGVKIVNRWKILGECYLDKLLKNMDYWKTLAKLDNEKFSTELTY